MAWHPTLLSHASHTINPSFVYRPTDRSYNSGLAPPAQSCLLSRNSKIRFWKEKAREGRHERGSRRSLNNSFLSTRDLRSPLPPPLLYTTTTLRLLLRPQNRRKSIAEIQVQHTGRAAAAAAEALPAGVFPPIERRRHAPTRSVRPRPRRRRRPDLIPTLPPAGADIELILALRPSAYRRRTRRR